MSEEIMWGCYAKAKFQTAISKMPFFHRRIAEKLVRNKAESLAREKKLPEY